MSCFRQFQKHSVINMEVFVFIVVLCTAHVSIADDINKSEKNTQVYKTAKILLVPPTNVTTLFVSENDIFIIWAPPAVYPLHNVNGTLDNMDDDTYWTNHTIDINQTETWATTVSPNDTMSSNTSDSSEKGNNSTASKPTPATVEIKKPKCVMQDKFKVIDKLEIVLSMGNVINFVTDRTKVANTTERQNGTDVFVDFDKGCVEKYFVNYQKNGSETVEKIEVNLNTTEFNMTGLDSGTTYVIFVSAEFTSGDILQSDSIAVITLKKSVPAVCHCSHFGTVAGWICTLNSTQWCHCNPGYTGLFCEVCQSGYYRSAPYFPCNKCPCSHLATRKPTCHYREGYLVCDACKSQYSGHLCQTCIDGYYRYHGRCIPCWCNMNADHNAPRMCDPYSGACYKCLHNTTGFKCENCLPGYVREFSRGNQCLLDGRLHGMQSGPSTGVIAGIVIAVILALSAIVGFLVYRRWKIFPPRKPFWTVELKEDRDSVNFSSVPGQDYSQHDAADIADLEFYERHQGKPGGKGVSSYSQLKEDI